MMSSRANLPEHQCGLELHLYEPKLVGCSEHSPSGIVGAGDIAFRGLHAGIEQRQDEFIQDSCALGRRRSRDDRGTRRGNLLLAQQCPRQDGPGENFVARFLLGLQLTQRAAG